MMRKRLQEIQNSIDWIDTDNLYQSVNDIKKVLGEIVEQLDKALPLEVEPD